MKNVKSKFKVLLSLLLAVLMLAPSMTVFAAESNTKEQAIESNIIAIEESLSANGTDVLKEINDMITDYTALLPGATTTEETAKIMNLIATLEEMRDEYTLYASGISTCKFHLIYSPAVAAVIAYFNSKGYDLSAELLTHAKQNTVVNTNYVPVNGQRVKQSNVFTSIAKATKTSGSASFPNEGNSVQKDLYYAIHAFSYTKTSATSKTVTIRDRYDFAPGDYNGIAGIAIDTMYKAQEAGVIVPYYVNITATA